MKRCGARLLAFYLAIQQLVFSVPASATVNAPTGLPVDSPTLAQHAAGGSPRVATNGNTGDATYRVPIALPPGTGDLTPGVALAYSSAATRDSGPLGVGWSLDIGPSVIQRSTRDGAPAYDATDSFELAGRPLKATQTAGRYVAENHDFTRIEHVVSGGDYWRVLRPDGTRLYFGFTPASVLQNVQVRATDPTSSVCPDPFVACTNREIIVNGGIPFAWYLDRIEDRNGNVVRLVWQSQGDLGMRYLTQILYSEHVSGSAASVPTFGGPNDGTLARTRTLTFSYNLARGDFLPQYRAGFPRQVRNRMSGIDVAVDGSLVRRYLLEYEQSVASGRSRLVTLRERGASGASSNELVHTFSYGNGGVPSGPGGTFWSALDSRWDLSGSLTYVSAGQDQGIRIVDVNTDGYPDVVRANSGTRQTYLGGPNGFSTTASPGWTLPIDVKDANGYAGTVFGDFDADGRQDILQRRIAITGTNEHDENCDGGGTNRHHEVGSSPAATLEFNQALINTGSGWLTDSTQRPGFYRFEPEKDVIEGSASRSCPYEYLPMADRVDGVAGGLDQGTRVIDMNGDGRDDLVYLRELAGFHPQSGTTDKYWKTFEIRAGTFLNQEAGLASGTLNNFHDSSIYRFQAADMERHTDFRKFYGNPRWQMPAFIAVYAWSNLFLCKATQNFLFESHTGHERFADINSDGLPDLVEHSANLLVDPPDVFRDLINNGYGWKAPSIPPEQYFENHNFDWLHYDVFPNEHAYDGSTAICVQNPPPGYAIDWGTRLIDVNGDGGPDRLGGTIFTGGNHSYRRSGLWSAQPLEPQAGFFAHWALTPQWDTPVGFTAQLDLATGTRLADVNADGMVDILVSTGAYLNLGEPPDMLTSVSSPWGAVTTVEYRPNSDFETAPQANPDVGGQRRHSQPRWVASRVSVNPGAPFAQPTVVRDFEYYEPIYDIADRSFRGFRTVLELGPVVGAVRSATRTTFHTSDSLRGSAREIVTSSVTVNPQDPENRSLWSWATLRRKLLDYASASGAVPTPTVTFADGTTGTLPSIGDTLTGAAFTAFGALLSGSPAAAEAFLAFPVRETVEEYEGLASPLVAQTRRGFDFYGNVLELARLGDPGTPVDDVTATLSYVVADSTGGAGLLLANRPWRVQVTGSASGVPAGTTLSRSLEVLYDGNVGNPATQNLIRGNPTQVRHAWTNANGQSTFVAISRAFDVYGNLTRADAPVDVGTTPPNLSFSTIQYDSVSATFPVVVAVGSTAGAQYDLVSTIEYETSGCGSPLGMGLPCRLIDPNGQVETHQYDAFGREIASTGPNGAATATLYYDAARGTIDQRTETRTRWSSTGPADPSLDANAISEVRYFDGLGRTLEEARSGLGANVARRFTFYDAAGRVDVVSRWDFGTNPVASTFYEYDAVGRILAEALPDGTLHAYGYAPRQATTTTSIPVDGLVHKRVAKVDALGRLSEVQEFEAPNGAPAVTTYTHDAFDQLVQVRDAVANNATLCGSNPACPGQTHVTTAYFDELGNRTRLDDPDSGTWLSSYDARGLVGLTEDPRHKLQLYAYDPLGRLETRTAGNPDTFETGDTYTYGLVGTAVPNGLGRVVRIQDQLGEDSFEYDAAGNTSLHRRILFARRFDFARVYDPAGRVTATTYPDGETATWHFDKRLLTRISSVNGAYAGDYVSNVTYDALDRELNIGLGNTPGSPLATDTRTYHSTSGRLQSLEGKIGSQRVGFGSYSIDGAGRVRSIVGETMSVASGILQPFSFDYSYDGLDRLVGSAGNEYVYDHDVLGNLVKKDSQQSNGFGWATLQYADPARPHALTHAVSTDATRTLDYSYDAAGNVIQKNRTGYQGAPGQGSATVNFTYDSQGRLRSVTDAASAIVLGYAADGRHLYTRRLLFPRVDLPEPDFEYHASNTRVNKHFFVGGTRVASSARTWTAPAASLPALLTWRGPDWDAPPPWAYAAAYATLGLLLLGAALRRRETEAAARAFALRLSSAGTLLLVAPALMASPCGVGPPPITTDFGTHNEPALFYLTDHLGSTILTVEDGGTVRNRYVYMPFGDPGIYNEGPSLRHRFTGEEILEGTGLYVLGARVYDPETGRFLQPDPLVANPADPQSFNRYTYALNNPMSWMDPSGLAYEEAPIGGGGGSVSSGAIYPDDPFDHSSQDFFNQWDGGSRPSSRAGGDQWHLDFFDFLASNPFSGLTELAAGPREGPAAAPGSPSQGARTPIEQIEAQGVAYVALVGDGTPTGNTLTGIGPLLPGGPLLGPAAGAAGRVGKTVLGHKGEYVEKALELGARYLDVPTAIWDKMSRAEKWAANQRFLDRAIARGDDFILATKASAARTGSLFARELEYLASKGYRAAEDGLRLIAPGK